MLRRQCKRMQKGLFGLLGISRLGVTHAQQLVGVWCLGGLGGQAFSDRQCLARLSGLEQPDHLLEFPGLCRGECPERAWR